MDRDFSDEDNLSIIVRANKGFYRTLVANDDYVIGYSPELKERINIDTVTQNEYKVTLHEGKDGSNKQENPIQINLWEVSKLDFILSGGVVNVSCGCPDTYIEITAGLIRLKIGPKTGKIVAKVDMGAITLSPDIGKETENKYLSETKIIKNNKYPHGGYSELRGPNNINNYKLYVKYGAIFIE